MRQHLVQLDGLRGIAAISVVLFHLSHIVGFGAFGHGFLAVDFFFLLSGFVIALAYEDKLKSGSLTPKSFALVRLKRLYPMLFVGFVLGSAAVFLGANPLASPGPWMLLQFALVPLFGAVLYPLNDPIWSILHEMIVNLFHAATAKKLLLKYAVGIVVLTGVLFLGAMAAKPDLGANWGWKLGGNFAGGVIRTFFDYFLGVTLFRLSRPITKALMPVPFFLPAALLGLVLVVPLQHFPIVDILAVFLVFPAILVLSLNAKAPALMIPFYRWLGGVSYPVYAVHTPILLIMAHFFPTKLWPVTLLLVLLLASALEYGFDAPLRLRLRPMKGAHAGEPQSHPG